MSPVAKTPTARKRYHTEKANELLYAVSAMAQAKRELESAIRHCRRAGKAKLRLEAEIALQRAEYTHGEIERSFKYHNRNSA